MAPETRDTCIALTAALIIAAPWAALYIFIAFVL